MITKGGTIATLTDNKMIAVGSTLQHSHAPFFKPVLQTKLAINKPGDVHEQEADSMAEKVMNMPVETKAAPFFKPAPITLATTQRHPLNTDEGEKIEPAEDEEGPVQLKPTKEFAVQRTCAACEEDEKLQRKEIAPVQEPSIDLVPGVLHSPGQQLDDSTRSFMEQRFGHDFSHVQVHNDGQAHQSSADINALAYTNKNHIVFAEGQFQPETNSGKKLLAHELTHVVQQGNGATGKLQRAPAPPVDIKVQEKALKDNFNAILKTTNAAAPGDAKAKIEISKLVGKFQTGFADYKPSMPHFWIEPEHGDTEYYRYANVYRKSEATQLAARLLLIGMPKESAIFYQLGKPSTTVGVFPRDQPDEFKKAYTQASLERIDLKSQAKADASLDILLSSFNYMVEAIKKLDMKKVEADMTHKEFYGTPEKITEYGFMGEWPYYMSLLGHLGKLYGGMQQIVQFEMEKVYVELDKSGQASSIVLAYAVLEKMKTKLPTNVKFSHPGSSNMQSFSPTLSPVAITQTDFSKKGGVHRDVFDKSSKAPSIKIEYYDKEQKEGVEKFVPINELHKIRYQQLDYIQAFYGLDTKGKKTAGKQGPSELMPGKTFSLFSLDDWKVFLDNKFDDLVKKQGKSNADAFLTVINLLEGYMKAFTIHTSYNIIDKGDNYLTKTFPRALTGQLIHDCGVYALKTVYLLSLLATRLKLQLQYIMLPNHVGLIIRGDQTPVIIVHNNEFLPFPLSEAQFDTLSKENQQTILNDRELKDYEKARKKGDTTDFKFTIDKQKQDWDKFTKDKKLKGPSTEKQFLAEKAANLFVNSVDMPFAIVDIKAKDFDPKTNKEKIKKKLWADYQEMVRDTVFFDRKAMAEEFSPTYQFNLRYLNLTVAEKNFHNNVLVPYWNFRAQRNWTQLTRDLRARVDAKDKAGYIKLLETYSANFVKGSTDIEKSYQPIIAQKDQVHQTATTNDPRPLRSGVERTIGVRSVGETWRIAFQGHLSSLEQRIKNLKNGTESLTAGTDITPVFATDADRLQYIP
jgi:hypothetical protein